MVKRYLEFITEKSSGQIYNPKRGDYEEINTENHKKELSDEFFDLINKSYSQIGGHSKIKSPDDVFSDWNYWAGIDIHGSNDYDIVVFGQKTNYGVKFSGTGHDGEKDSIKKYMDEFGKKLNTYGYYAEVSDKLGEILTHKYKLHIVNNQEDVEKVLGKKVEWKGEVNGKSGNGWYSRKIGGHNHTKLLVGNPKGL